MVRLYRTLESSYFENYSAYLEAQADFDKLREKLGDDYFNKWIKVKDKIGDKIKDPAWVRTSPDEPVKFIPNPDKKYKNIYDILKYNDEEIEELKNFLDNYKTKRATITQKKIDGAEKIGENDEYVCYRITKYPAAQYYGSNTTWCITGRYKGEEEQGRYYFNKYIKGENLDGGYYFFIHKSNPRRKYALLQKKDKTIHSIWSALNSPLTMDRVPVFPLVKEIPELEDIYKDVDIENPEHIKDRDRKSLEHDILISCRLPEENSKDAIRNLKEILEGDTYKDYKFNLNNIKDNYGETPLSNACYEDNIEIVKFLIEHGADVNSKDKYDNTPLIYACKNDNTELAKFLLEHDADVNIKGMLGKTPLYWACSNRNLNLAKLLLEHGTDVNSKNRDGETTLYLACYCDDTELVKLLLEYGADVNSKTRYEYTPLYLACKNSNTEIAKLLLEHGANKSVNSEDKYGNTPLLKACFGDNTELAKLLIEHGADVNIKNEDGDTPLYEACFNDNIELAKLLLEHGADVNNKGGSSPLYRACKSNHTEIVKLLLQHGAWKDLDADNLSDSITRNKEIEDLVLSYLNKNKGRNESIRLRRLYRR